MNKKHIFTLIFRNCSQYHLKLSWQQFYQPAVKSGIKKLVFKLSLPYMDSLRANLKLFTIALCMSCAIYT